MAELQARMSGAEFSDWMAYYRLEPFGQEPANYRMAVLASLAANANRDAKRRPQPFVPEDFMPREADAEAGDAGRGTGRRQTLEQQMATAAMAAALFGGTITRNA